MFCKKETLIQPPGEPREHHLGEVRSKKFDIQKLRKQKKTEGSIIYSGFFLKSKKVKNEVTALETHCFFW